MVHEYAAIYLAVGIENVLEEILLQWMLSDPHKILTSTMLEYAIANKVDVRGLLQSYAHLDAGSIAFGMIMFHTCTFLVVYYNFYSC